jgi:hypothetical protein
VDEMNRGRSPEGNPSKNDEVFELLALRYLDDVHAESDARLLAEQLASSPEKREAFAALSIEVGLLKEMSLATQPETESYEIGRKPSVKSIAFGKLMDFGLRGRGLGSYLHFSAFSLLFIGLLLGVVFGWMLRRDRQRSVAVTSTESRIVPVAYLTATNGCAWGGGTPQVRPVGSSVQLGDEIALHDGIAEFRLSSGVILTIEGPAALVLNSPASVIVQHGKLTTRVPWEVNDFKVLASTCRITACDTEFSVNVAGSEVDVHVFSGEAIVCSSPFEAVEAERWEQGIETTGLVQQEENLPSGSWFAKARVPQGRGLALMSNDGMMRVSGWHAAVEGEFAAKLSMAGQLPASSDYVDVVMKSKPVGYWRFEAQKDGRIPNEVSSNELRIVGSVHFLGDNANQMIELGRIGSEGYLVSSKPMNVLAGTNYSVEVWVKPSHSHRGGIASLVSSPHTDGSFAVQSNLHAFSLELTGAQYSRALKVQGLKDVYRSRIRFLHRDPPGGDYNTGTSCFSADPYMFRRWQQIVAVKQGRKLRLYVDGKLAATSDDPTFLARNLYLEVGQFIGTTKVLPFVGQLDELSVYKRALSEEEIKQHYKSMNWSPKARNSGPKTDA